MFITENGRQVQLSKVLRLTIKSLTKKWTVYTSKNVIP
jgi:hypothetical protein